MVVELEFISLIIPIDKIEGFYPGGFSKYKKDNRDSIGKVVWFDQFLVREGAMNPMDIEERIKVWESYGLIGIVEEEGRKTWKDLCVVDFMGGKTLPCDWLVSMNNGVAHIEDKTGGGIECEKCFGF